MSNIKVYLFLPTTSLPHTLERKQHLSATSSSSTPSPKKAVKIYFVSAFLSFQHLQSYSLPFIDLGSSRGGRNKINVVSVIGSFPTLLLH